jgi:PAS domain S-box-containing protein
MRTPPETIRVLHVDDDPTFVDVSASLLEREDERFAVTAVTSADEGLRRLSGAKFDCVVSDYEMPGRNGIEFLEAVREAYPDLPFILFTGKGSEEIASDAISAGVSDYLGKGSGRDRYPLLANRIENLVAQHRSERQLETRAEQQEHLTELGQEALAGAPLETLFEHAVAAVSETLGVEYAKVLEYRPTHDDLLLRAGVGWSDGLVGEATVGTGDDSQAGHTLRSEEPVVVEDLRTEDRFRGPPILTDHGVVSGISVIIGSTDDPWGVLGAHTTERTTFTEDAVNFVRTVANILAAAVEKQAAARQRDEIFGRISDAFFALDEEWRFTYLNDEAHELINPEDRQLEGKYVWDEFPAATEAAFKPMYERAMYEQETVSFEEYYPEPLNAWFEVRTYPSETGLSVYFRDVTERHERERRLAESERRYRTLAESFPNGIVTLFDHDLRYTLAAGRAFDEHSLSPADVEGQTPTEVWSADVAEALEPVLRAALDGDSGSVEVTYDGREWLVHAVPVTDDDGEVLSGMTVSQDVTERKDREERLERFASIVSHDLRNPLNVAEGHRRLASEECNSDHLDAVGRAHGRMFALIDDLLTLAREGGDVSDVESVALRDVVETCWGNVATPGATMRLDVDQSIRADRSRLAQLFENLFRNAVEHGGADVTVTVGTLDDGFYVADDGPGIPESERDDVFEGGYSTDDDGTGFGLRIVRQVADAHGWAVRVTDSESGGARFEIRGVTFTQ